ncbi:MAG: hypothetical protein JXA14_00715 [Anaerolineae bacterium]|nr:hypothetical protein [Anaerolineae bacterium]
MKSPPAEDVEAHQGLISHPSNVRIVLATIKSSVDYLVILSRRRFIDDPGVAHRSGSRIGAPGDALAWVRGQLARPGQ